MKNIIATVAVCLLASFAVHAQTWEEWVQQKKTQKKYLIQQIAALQVYFGYAKKGYEVVGKGINTIRDVKNGDFNLHRNFFTSLLQVNPALREYGKVAGIINYQVQVINSSKQTLKNAVESKQFTPAEMDHCKRVYDFLLGECLKSIDELAAVMTADKLQMKDDERLNRIDRLYADMQEKYAFSSSFGEEMDLLSAQRMGEHFEINRSKLINGIK